MAGEARNREAQRNPEVDFDTLIAMLAAMIETQRGQFLSPVDAWINDAQVLCTKLFKQACSTRVILNRTLIKFEGGAQIGFIDHSSATVLARACIETFLVIHWIFQSQDPALRKFRHGAWRLGGLVDRMKLHPTTEEARAVQAATRLQLAEQLAEIKDSPFLAAYKPDQVKRLLKGDWRIGWSWAEEAVRAGFNEKYFRNVYSHFCGYAHSSYISSLQMEQANTFAAQRMLGEAPLQTCVHVIARAIAFYQELFPGSRATVDAASEEARKVAYYWSFTGSDMDHLFEDSSQGEE